MDDRDTPVWLQRWRVEIDGCGPSVVRSYWGGVFKVDQAQLEEDDCRLAADAPGMLRLWLVNEFCGESRGCASCPYCLSGEKTHDAGCPIDELLTRQGFPTAESRDQAREKIRAWMRARLEPWELVEEDPRLDATAHELVRVLLTLEWVSVESDEGHVGPVCGSCERGPYRGDGSVHEPGCRVDVALTTAGFPDQASRDAAREAISGG